MIRSNGNPVKASRMYLIHNERTKLTATWLNTLATALVAAGVFAPAAALIYGVAATAINTGYLFASAFGCFCLGGGLHVLGRSVLRRLRE